MMRKSYNELFGEILACERDICRMQIQIDREKVLDEVVRRCTRRELREEFDLEPHRMKAHPATIGYIRDEFARAIAAR